MAGSADKDEQDGGSFPLARDRAPQHVTDAQRRREEERIARAVRRRRNKKMALLAVLVVIVVGIYFAGVMHFSGRFMDRTTIGGIDISKMTVPQAQTLLDNSTASYSLTITGHDFEAIINSSDIGLSLDTDCTAAMLIVKRNPYLWPFEVWFSRDLTEDIDVIYDEQALTLFLQQTVDEYNLLAEPLQEASVAYDEKTQRFVYSGPSAGTQLIYEQVKTETQNALVDLRRSLDLSEGCRVQPPSSDATTGLEASAEQANALIDQFDITFILGDGATFSVDRSLAAQWVSFDDGHSVSLDQTKMDSWIRSVLNLLDSQGGERIYLRPDGKEITVSGGDYGWKAADLDVAEGLIRDALAKKGVQALDIVCTVTGNGFLGLPGADWGKRYIDVDISEQYARFYESDGSLIWESEIITGTRWTDFETPTGVYAIQAKASPASLRSTGPYAIYNEDGTVTIEENHQFGRDVEYWMPFIGTFIGFHDAWWQSSFGGDLYEDPRLGSGGCINLPPDKAAELYGLIQEGDVVVTHW